MRVGTDALSGAATVEFWLSTTRFVVPTGTRFSLGTVNIGALQANGVNPFTTTATLNFSMAFPKSLARRPIHKSAPCVLSLP